MRLICIRRQLNTCTDLTQRAVCEGAGNRVSSPRFLAGDPSVLVVPGPVAPLLWLCSRDKCSWVPLNGSNDGMAWDGMR